MSPDISLSTLEALCAAGASFVPSVLLLSRWLSPAVRFWEGSAVRPEGAGALETQLPGASTRGAARTPTPAGGSGGTHRGERNPAVLVLVCALLGLAQLAMHVLAHVADVPTGWDAVRVPLSCVLFPLNLAALLYLYLTRNSTSFGWVLIYVVGVNLCVAGLTCVLRGGWLALPFVEPGWGPKLWSAEAMYTVLCGTSTTVIVTVLMVFLCRALEPKGPSSRRRELGVIVLTLSTALVVDSVLYSFIVYAFLGEPFLATVWGHLLCQLLVGAAYAGCVWLALRPKARATVIAPAPSAPRFFRAALRQVAQRLALWLFRAVRWARKLFALTSIVLRDTRIRFSALVSALVSAWRPKRVAPTPDPQDLPTTGPFADLHRAALERFAAERGELVGRPELRGKWVVYAGGARVDGVADESRARLFRRCLDELKLARGRFTLLLVEPELAETGPPVENGAAEVSAGGNLPTTGPFADLHRAALERFAAERGELVGRPELRGKWVVYAGGARVDGVADESRARLFRRCLDELKLARGRFTLLLVEPELAETGS